MSLNAEVKRNKNILFNAVKLMMITMKVVTPNAIT